MELFHKSFLNILTDNDPLQKQTGNLKNSSNISIENVTDIIRLAPVFISGVKRDQMLIKTHNDYYIAKDTLTNTVYICFKDLLTIDIDIDIDIDNDNVNDNDNDNDKNIIDHFSKLSETFRIYKTPRGYHVYCTSRYFPYRERTTIEYMLNNLCDKYYCVYSYIRGFSTRLNNKFNNQGQILYKYLGKTNGEENSNLVKLVNLMERKSIKYKNDLNFN
jgi:hypothetical protein